MAQLEFLIKSFPSLIWGVPNNRPGGLVMSLLLSFAGLSFGLVLATGLGLARAASVRAIRAPATALVRVIRGIPLVLLLLVAQRAVVLGTGVGGRSSSIIAAVVALTLYAAAYQTDIIEAGLRAVPQTLIEEAALLGAGPLKRYFSLKLPYGLRVMRPALLSQTITLFKDSSVVVVLGVADLTTTARLILGSDVGNAPYWVGVYLTVGFIYFCVSFLLSRMTNRIEGSAARIGLLVNSG